MYAYEVTKEYMDLYDVFLDMELDPAPQTQNPILRIITSCVIKAVIGIFS
jgi:hypothetical protein